MGDAPSPRFLSRQQAATYLGVSLTTFDAEMKSGMSPTPLRRGGKATALTWDIRLLDRACDRIGGIIEASAPGDDLAAAEQAALEAAGRGTKTGNRRQHRHAKAA